MKEDNYGRLATLLSERALVLPDHPEMLRQLGGVAATPTPLGRLRIGARYESLHDDLPDALALAVGRLPRQLADPTRRDIPEGQNWAETPGGVRVPVPVRTLRPDISWFCANADMSRCHACGHARRTGAKCGFCGAAAETTRRLRCKSRAPLPSVLRGTGRRQRGAWSAAADATTPTTSATTQRLPALQRRRRPAYLRQQGKSPFGGSPGALAGLTSGGGR